MTRATGLFETPNKQPRYYYSSDNLQSDAYKGLTPKDLIDIAMFHGLHFDGANAKGSDVSHDRRLISIW